MLRIEVSEDRVLSSERVREEHFLSIAHFCHGIFPCYATLRYPRRIWPIGFIKSRVARDI